MVTKIWAQCTCALMLASSVAIACTVMRTQTIHVKMGGKTSITLDFTDLPPWIKNGLTYLMKSKQTQTPQPVPPEPERMSTETPSSDDADTTLDDLDPDEQVEPVADDLVAEANGLLAQNSEHESVQDDSNTAQQVLHCAGN